MTSPRPQSASLTDVRALKDFSPGAIVFSQEQIGDEVREVFYLRESWRLCYFENNVPVIRLAVAQGDPSDSLNGLPPRYYRGIKVIMPGSEADGRTLVQHLLTNRMSVWGKFLRIRETVAALTEDGS